MDLYLCWVGVLNITIPPCTAYKLQSAAALTPGPGWNCEQGKASVQHETALRTVCDLENPRHIPCSRLGE